MLTNAKTKTQTRSVRYGSWPSLLLLIIILMVVFTYRGYLLYKYCAIYLDDDQALMWNGAAAMGHLCFPEPCYWGQAYGSMFEAVVAVPLYWLRIPMNIALPLATMIMSFFPYLFQFQSNLCYNRKQIDLFFHLFQAKLIHIEFAFL